MKIQNGNPQGVYIELLRKVLTGYIYPESANIIIVARTGWSPFAILQRLALRLMARYGFQLMRINNFNPAIRERGEDWPSVGYTMIGLMRLENVQRAVETILGEGIPGDLCECGVWRGGCAILMKAVLRERGCTDRLVWVADSFEGLPRPNSTAYPADRGYDLSQNKYLSVSLEAVQENFRRFDLLDGQVRFLKGWFKDTLPKAPMAKLAVLRVDGDLYESVMVTLTSLYDKVSTGGFVIIDDYQSWEPCRKAVDEFRSMRSIAEPLTKIDGCGVFWRKAKL